MITLNGNNVTELNQFIKAMRQDRARGDRHPTLTAHWVGGGRARVECDGNVLYIGGDGELNAMRVLLAALAACDVDLIATHASLMGLEVETLSMEVGGHSMCAHISACRMRLGPATIMSPIPFTLAFRVQAQSSWPSFVATWSLGPPSAIRSRVPSRSSCILKCKHNQAHRSLPA